MDGMETYSDVSKCVSQTASDFSFHPLSQPPVHDINDIVRFTLHYLWHLTLSRLYPASLPPSLTHSLTHSHSVRVCLPFLRDEEQRRHKES